MWVSKKRWEALEKRVSDNADLRTLLLSRTEVHYTKEITYYDPNCINRVYDTTTVNVTRTVSVGDAVELILKHLNLTVTVKEGRPEELVLTKTKRS